LCCVDLLQFVYTSNRRDPVGDLFIMGKQPRQKSKPRARIVRQPLFRFTRKLVFTQPKLAVDSGAYSNPRLVDFSNADIIGMFQQYKITRLDYTFRLTNAPNNNADFPTLNIAPVMFYSASPPTSRDVILALDGVKSYQFGPSNVSYTVSTVPKVSRGVLSSGIGYGISDPIWVDSNSNGVYQLGFGYWFARYNSTSSPTHSIEVEITAHVCARRAQ
jgi:hypothetical protein